MDVRAEMQNIFDLVRAGRIDAAEDRCRQSLDAMPGDINLMGLLGAILLKKGNLDEAERHLTRTTELEPAFPKPWEDLGALWMARKDPDTAARFFARAEALKREAAVPDVNLARAESLFRQGDVDAAAAACEEILRQKHDHAGALRLLAVVATDKEQYVVAEGYLRKIAGINGGGSQATVDLSRFLADRGRYPEAAAVLEGASTAVRADPLVQRLLGDMLSAIGRSTAAQAAYEKCLAALPDDVPALLGRGHMLRISGRADEAAESYRRCIELRPDFGDAWWNLASIQAVPASDEDILAMRSALASSTDQHNEVGLRFALARALEKRGNFADAWNEYVAGNALKRSQIGYDPVENEFSQTKIRKSFDATIVPAEKPQAPSDRIPIFIVGLPRSGSTLIEQILASHSQVQGGGELPYIVMLTRALKGGESGELRYPEVVADYDRNALTGLGRSYMHHVSVHLVDDIPFFTDKMPANFQHLGFIRLALPQARIIDARRHPMATCVANFRQLFAQGKNQSYDLTELGEYYLQYIETMKHWDEVIPGQVLHVQYEEVVAGLESQVRRILDFCGLPFEPACLDFHKTRRPVNTASADQVRQPIYNDAVDYWRNYEAYLDELREILAPVL